MENSNKTEDRRQLLLDRLASSYELKCNELKLESGEYQFWSLADPDSLLDEKTIETSHKDMLWQPYWAQLWDASIGLCHELSKRELNNQHILDLGCGLGATGAVAASRGAHVVLADNAPPALEFAKLNCWPWCERVSCRLVDWSNDQLPERFDIILGADIIYDPQDMKSLDQFWRYHLQASGFVLLSEPSRAMTGSMLETLGRFGWNIAKKTLSIEGLRTDIRIFELTL